MAGWVLCLEGKTHMLAGLRFYLEALGENPHSVSFLLLAEFGVLCHCRTVDLFPCWLSARDALSS